MREKLVERMARLWDAGKRFGFCSLWLAAIQALSCGACFGALWLLLAGAGEWLVYTLGLLLPVFWGIGGYWLPQGLRMKGCWPVGTFLALWTVLPALLCVWAGLDGPDILWVTLFPQLMARLAWFYALFEGVQPDYVLNNLQPLSGAGIHVLMMAGFALGFWLGGRKKKKVRR